MAELPFIFEETDRKIDSPSLFQGFGTALRRYTNTFLPQKTGNTDQQFSNTQVSDLHDNRVQRNFFIGGGHEPENQPIPRIDVIHENRRERNNLQNQHEHHLLDQTQDGTNYSALKMCVRIPGSHSHFGIF